ncbi:MAG: hypothetical protein ABIY50_10145 [Ignavibacteria bacterium]
MKINLTYVTDNKGKQKAIQMSIKEWNKFNEQFIKLVEYKKLKMDLSEATNEIILFESGKKKPRTLNQFLNDL